MAKADFANNNAYHLYTSWQIKTLMESESFFQHKS